MQKLHLQFSNELFLQFNSYILLHHLCLCTNIENEANIYCYYYPDIFVLMKKLGVFKSTFESIENAGDPNLFLPSSKIRERKREGETRLLELHWLWRSKFKNKMITFRHAENPIGFTGKNGERERESVCVCVLTFERGHSRKV